MKLVVIISILTNVLLLFVFIWGNYKQSEQLTVGFPVRVEILNKNAWSGKKRGTYLECTSITKEACGLTLRGCSVGYEYYCQTNVKVYPRVDGGI